MNNPKLAVQRKTVEAASGIPSATVTASGLYPFLDGYGIYAGECTTNAPAGTLPNTAPIPGQTLTTSPKIRVPSINIRVLNGERRHAVAVHAAATVFVKTADGLRHDLPEPDHRHQHHHRRRSRLAAQPGLPVRELQALRSAHRVRRPRTATRTSAREPARGLRREADHRGRRRDRRRTASTTRSSTRTRPARLRFPANPIYPNTPVLPATNGSIIVRLEPDRPMRVNARRARLGRARHDPHRDARGDVRGHGRPARGLHAAGPLVHRLRPDRRSRGRAPARPPGDGADDPPAALAGVRRGAARHGVLPAGGLGHRPRA